MKEFGGLGVCDPRDLEGVGKRLQSWNMGACRPAPAGLRVNDTNSKSLIWHNVFAFLNASAFVGG
ncbi:hypothetical protein [Rhizobium leguminosarum]|uniref:hypothetical protein n=1 Tax=Rhizobium leguminosarum TaxID=384 RepID=UPI0015F877B9|nr:hypothetical protein [Rhizobium leguminosarum]MBA9036018.1 hypothetical protein [Rhizobium leguminosarum]